MEKKGEYARYLWHQGTNFEAWKYFGCHFDGSDVVFRVYAPNAQAVSVVGDFNEWNDLASPMQRVNDEGVWQACLGGIKIYDNYKFCIQTKDGRKLLKSDPFAFHAETRGTASKVYDIGGFEWTDSVWQDLKAQQKDAPVNIYECHIASWRKDLGYREFAEQIIPYVKQMGFTHIELMGIAEYPFDGSWGYQVTGYFAPTSRYGTPHDFKYLINKCHENGVGVILDWVPGHFPRDAHGLYEFDGEPLYEPQNPLRSEHKEWGTLTFDYGRTEVQSFLISNAAYWAEEYHIDGLRADAVASMLYLDYNRRKGEYCPNSYGGNENLDAVAFFKKLNEHMAGRHKGVMMIAEESTAWPYVTKLHGGETSLGFDYKWNMGWMNDVLRYMKTDPYFRAGSHSNLTFSFFYAFSENYILPISHDECVHGKRSLLNKMFGDYDQKFNSLRAFLGYMFAHPGKKLLFMGNEFAQFDEWAHDKELDWMLLDFERHAQIKEYCSKLFNFYLNNAALWQRDSTWQGFEWAVADDANQNIAAFVRRGEDSELLFVVNFSPVERQNYRIGVENGEYKEVFSSDRREFGGLGNLNQSIKVENIIAHGKEQSISITIPAYGAIFIERTAQKTAAATKKPASKKATAKTTTKSASKTTAKPTTAKAATTTKASATKPAPKTADKATTAKAATKTTATKTTAPKTAAVKKASKKPI